MKVLVAIMSCHVRDHSVGATRDWFDGVRKNINPADQRQGCRDSWLQDMPIRWDYKFFVGYKEGFEPREDEVMLNCGDSYLYNGIKMHAICVWALTHGYDYVLRVDDDTMLWMKRIVALPWDQYDYLGNALADGSDPGVHAGFAVFMSRRLLKLVVRTAPGTTNNMWCDDVWVGSIAAKNQIKTHPQRSIQTRLGDNKKKDYYIDPDKLPMDHEYAALHSATPEVMRTIHEREKGL